MKSVPPPNNNDRTVIPQQLHTGLSPTTLSIIQPGDNALPIGSVLGEFEITDIIGWGGFGIVYLAYDHSLQRQIALKEYMPSSLAVRGSNASVSVKSEQHKETFQAGLRSFINEARLLAHFDHASLLKVYRFWESNGTAYMVMPYYKGLTLKETLQVMPSPPDEAWIKNLLDPLLDALDVLHKDQCFHRDIAPDNILILPDGRPLLLDFGAARRVISDMTQSLTVILKPGYAPIEQYGDVETMTQGPWTDIYALAAVSYLAITGQTPTASVSRIISDTLSPLTGVAAGRYSADFLRGIDQALAVRPEDRPQNVDALRRLLNLNKQQQMLETRVITPTLVNSKIVRTPATSKHPVALYAAITAMLIATISVVVFLASEEPIEYSAENEKILSNPPTTPITTQQEPFSPIKALDEIYENRDRNHAVTVSVEKAQVQIGRDQLRFEIRSARSGYVYLLMVGSNHSDFFLLFPNAVDNNNYIAVNGQLNLPRTEWRLIADGPPGTNHFIVVISDHPRDFSNAGLKTIDPFAEFPFTQSTLLYHSYTGAMPLFAGKVICPLNSAIDCDESYGAAVFSIKEIE